jgi:STAS-like domain of unknown function (DUF4325)
MVIRILDHVAQAATYADGEKIFTLIADPIRRRDHVTLSFDGIDAVPSSFINAAVVRLVEVVGIDVIKTHLGVVDSTRQINNLIRDRMAFLTALQVERQPSFLP